MSRISPLYDRGPGFVFRDVRDNSWLSDLGVPLQQIIAFESRMDPHCLKDPNGAAV